ncbi:VWA domain-containing protein, partial [Patescibacteria group bacterium]|nr:VWA domain-containing protein [Patescibacteria group bacterium]
MKINLQPQKAWKQPVLKSLHLVSMFALILNMSMLWVFMPQAAYAVTPVNPTPEPNPPFSESCGLDIGLVFDISGSINSTEMSQMKTAFQAFTTAFNGTPTQFSLTKFATNASVVQAFTDDISLINSKITSDIPGSGNGWTNWEDGLTKTHSLFDPRESKPDVIIFASDGNPNTTGTNGNANGGAAGETAAVNAAVLVANTIKTDTSHGEPQGIRIIALGIGANADGGDPALNVENLKKISGPNVDAGDITSDVITADFDQLAGTMSDLANQLCGGKILIQKQYDADADGVVDYDGSANNAALAGWTFEVNSTQKTTDDTGYLSFDVLNGTYSAVETNQKPDTEFIDATCEKGDQPIGTPTTNGVAGLTMETDDTIYCEFINSVSIYCGDGIKNGDEQCDGTDGVGPHQTCTEQCTLVDLTYCGDGAKQTPNDEGTGGPLNNGYEDCDGTDGVGAHQTCNSQCTLVDLTYCGDGTKQTPNDEGTGGPSNDGYEDCDGTDGVGFNQECTAQCTINELTCDLVITKSVDKTNTQPGEILTYTLNYINNGTGICTGTGVKIYDPLDNKVSYVNGSRSIQILNDTEGDGYHATEGNDYNGTNKTLIYNVNRVSPGESGSITFEATVNNFDGCGESIIPNRGKIWSNQTNYIWSNYVYTTANKNCEGELTVIKHVVGDDASASDWTINITGPENDSFAGSENGVSRTLDQGDYNVAESNGSSNYTLSYSGNCDANGDVSISHGDNKTCTLTNTRDEGTITVNKFVEYPDGSTDYNPADWAWYLNGGDALTGGTTKTIPTNVMQNVSEDMTHYPEDNYYTTWTCNTVGDVVTPIANGTGTTFNIKATYHGHDIVCTFTNTRITTEVTFDKVVVGGEHEDSAWAFAIDGNGAYHEGDYAVLPINEQYVVTETSSYDALYTLTGASGICELVDGKIMLNTNAGNDFNVCIVENTRNTGSIGGTKFSDLNGNGVQNTGEPVIEGVEIKLDNSMSTTTDANGAYLFENLPTGLYEVMEVVPI